MSDAERLSRARDAGAIPAGARLIAFNPGPDLASALSELAAVAVEQARKPEHDALATAGLPVSPEIEASGDVALVCLDRARALSRALIARAARAAPRVIVTGAKTDGIDAIAGELARLLPEGGRLAKAHGKIAWYDARPLPATFAAWEAAAIPARGPHGFLTAPGMFSADGPDPGSVRLAAQFGPEIAGHVAELGAGWGWLAATLLAAAPGVETLDLHEADHRALAAARANVQDPRARFHWTDVARLPTPSAPLDRVVMNPPFHAGRSGDPGLGRAFIAAAARLLGPRGRLLMVANRHLPYEAALAEAFLETRTREEAAGYKIIEARRPRRR
ncbi:MAG: methyltransferase [Pseudomonadota bacterium]